MNKLGTEIEDLTKECMGRLNLIRILDGTQFLSHWFTGNSLRPEPIHAENIVPDIDSLAVFFIENMSPNLLLSKGFLGVIPTPFVHYFIHAPQLSKIELRPPFDPSVDSLTSLSILQPFASPIELRESLMTGKEAKEITEGDLKTQKLNLEICAAKLKLAQQKQVILMANYYQKEYKYQGLYLKAFVYLWEISF